jgi:FkbM family methyltransferase
MRMKRAKPDRYPTMQDSLNVLLDAGVPVNTVLDVGILTGTAPLIETLPKVPHHLFEPVDLHFDQINKNYRNIESKLHHVALSDEDGEIYLARRAIHRDGRITHSEIVNRPVTTADFPDLVDCKSVPRRRLDSIATEEDWPDNCLLKVDVDGHEIEVLAGAEDTLRKTSIAIIEAPLNRVSLPHFFARSEHMRSRGFYLMDIVDLAYYDGVLWQVDLVFVREDIVQNTYKLRPFQAENFKFEREKWLPLGQGSYK